jgi:hypothetical protein
MDTISKKKLNVFSTFHRTTDMTVLHSYLCLCHNFCQLCKEVEKRLCEDDFLMMKDILTQEVIELYRKQIEEVSRTHTKPFIMGDYRIVSERCNLIIHGGHEEIVIEVLCSLMISRGSIPSQEMKNILRVFTSNPIISASIIKSDSKLSQCVLNGMYHLLSRDEILTLIHQSSMFIRDMDIWNSSAVENILYLLRGTDEERYVLNIKHLLFDGSILEKAFPLEFVERTLPEKRTDDKSSPLLEYAWYTIGVTKNLTTDPHLVMKYLGYAKGSFDMKYLSSIMSVDEEKDAHFKIAAKIVERDVILKRLWDELSIAMRRTLVFSIVL